MTNESKSRINGASGWVTATIAIASILILIGSIYAQVCSSTEADVRQDKSIVELQQDMAVMKALSLRTSQDVGEIKMTVKEVQTDLKTLLRR